ncbi:MAG: alpha/beta hydrolase [Clostridiales bacterium]|jgi:pimeloyl-ACP methyl ester carboxylesterase|nr:alpha/beta hydrolase [Clostridiales bacterium]
MFEKVNGLDLYYEEYGSENGEAVIFLHGNGGSVKTFERTKDVFLRDKRVFLIDSRGHGQSAFEGDIDFPAMGSDIADFVRAKGLDSVSLVGYSDGGIVAIEAAALLGGVVKKMVIIGANLRFDGMKSVFNLGLRIEYALFSLLSFMPKYKKLRRYFRIMLTQPEITAEKLKSVTARTLVVAGERDVIKAEHTAEIAEKLPNAELTIVPGADHFLFSKRNGEINEIIRGFLCG